MLECTRNYCSNAVYIFCSTNKVYGDTPNRLPLKEFTTRYEFDDMHFINGIDENMTIDKSLHSLFGAGKVSADCYTTEVGKYFGMNTVSFRMGCLTGIAAHGARLHNYLDYIVKCAVNDIEYRIEGYKGKQVRDVLDFSDLCEAFYEFYKRPRSGEIYNLGGAHQNSISIIETINYLEQAHNLKLTYAYNQVPRRGDHICWYTCNNKFKMHYPNWEIKKSVHQIIDEIVEKYKNE